MSTRRLADAASDGLTAPSNARATTAPRRHRSRTASLPPQAASDGPQPSMPRSRQLAASGVLDRNGTARSVASHTGSCRIKTYFHVITAEERHRSA